MKSDEKKKARRGIFNLLRGDRGSAMLIAMMIMVILTLVGISFLILSDTENNIAINDRDFQQVLYIGGGAAKIVENGGKQRMPVREYYPGEKPYRMVYCEDPFGNLIEIYSHSYELTYSAGAYQE